MTTRPFVLSREFIKLNQLLKAEGLCDSGGAGKVLVADGTVKVDGQVELRKTAKIRAGQVVEVDGVAIQVCAASDRCPAKRAESGDVA